MSIVEDSTELISPEWPEGEPQIGDQLGKRKPRIGETPTTIQISY